MKSNEFDLKIIVDEIIMKYEYLDIDKNELFKYLSNKTRSKEMDVSSIYDIANSYVSKRIKDMFKNDNTAIKIINKYIDTLFLNQTLTPLECLKKIINFFNEFELNPSDTIIVNLTKSNHKFSNIIDSAMLSINEIDDIEDKKLKNIINLFTEYKETVFDEEEEGYKPEILTDSMTKYLKEISKISLLSKEEEKELAILSRNGDLDAKNKLIKANLRFVVKIARGYYTKGLDMLDLIQEGNLGLIEAVERFDPDKGFRFSTYSYWWIRTKIARATVEKGRNIKLPVVISYRLDELKSRINALSVLLNRQPTTEEIISKLNITYEQLATLYRLQNDTVSIESIIYDGNNDESGKELEDYLYDEEYSVEDMIVKKDFRKNIRKILKSCNLTEMEIETLILRNGFVDEPKTLEYIGAIYGVSRERIRQVEKNALNKIRNSSNVTLFAQYSESPDKAIKKIASVRRSKLTRDFYETFKSYTKEQIDEAITQLTEDEKKALDFLYSDDDQAMLSIGLSKIRQVKNHLKYILNPKYAAYYRYTCRLKQTKEAKANKETVSDDKKEVPKTSVETEPEEIIDINRDEVYEKILDLTTSKVFKKLKTLFTNEEAIILMLHLGHIDYKHFTNREISYILELPVQKVAMILDEKLPIYTSNIDNLLHEIVVESRTRNNLGDDNNARRLIKK